MIAFVLIFAFRHGWSVRPAVVSFNGTTNELTGTGQQPLIFIEQNEALDCGAPVVKANLEKLFDDDFIC
jgi:hypothetical protein